MNIFTCMRFLFPRCDWPLRAFHPLSLLSFLFFLFFSRSRRDKARKEVRTSAPGCFHRRMGARLCPQAKTFVDLRLDRRDFEAISRYPVCVLFFFFFRLLLPTRRWDRPRGFTTTRIPGDGVRFRVPVTDTSRSSQILNEIFAWLIALRG